MLSCHFPSSSEEQTQVLDDWGEKNLELGKRDKGRVSHNLL